MHFLELKKITQNYCYKYLATGEIPDGATITRLKYEDFDPIVFKCNDIMDACMGLSGFCLGNDHCYLSMIYANEILRFKFRLPVNISEITSIPLQHTYSTKGKLNNLMTYIPNGDYNVGQVYARYPIYIQYMELKGSLSRIIKDKKAIDDYLQISQ